MRILKARKGQQWRSKAVGRALTREERGRVIGGRTEDKPDLRRDEKEEGGKRRNFLRVSSVSLSLDLSVQGVGNLHRSAAMSTSSPSVPKYIAALSMNTRSENVPSVVNFLHSNVKRSSHDNYQMQISVIFYRKYGRHSVAEDIAYS